MTWHPIGSALKRGLSAVLFSLVLTNVAALQAEEDPEAPDAVSTDTVGTDLTRVEGTSVYANEEEPRILHIVPWQTPTVAQEDRRQLKIPDAEAVLQPIDVDQFRTHRQFRRTLDILDVDRSGP